MFTIYRIDYDDACANGGEKRVYESEIKTIHDVNAVLYGAIVEYAENVNDLNEDYYGEDNRYVTKIRILNDGQRVELATYDNDEDEVISMTSFYY